MEATISVLSRPVMLNDGQRLLRIDLNEVAYFEADRVYCKMHMRDGQTVHTLNSPLGTVERSLPKDAFVRIHRSYIVNIWRIQMIIGRFVKLDTGDHFTLGEQYCNALDDSFLVLGEKGS